MENSSRFLKLSGTRKRGQKKKDRKKGMEKRGQRKRGQRKRGQATFFPKKVACPLFLLANISC